MRSIILGPSGSGNTVLFQNMILDIYKDGFSIIYICSPTINVDYTWDEVNKYISKEMGVEHTEDEPIYFDHYDAVALHNIIDVQHQITTY